MLLQIRKGSPKHLLCLALAIFLCVAPGFFTLVIGRGLWGVGMSASIEGETPGGDVGLGIRSYTDFYVSTSTFVISVAVSIVGLVLLIRLARCESQSPH